jgi:hypothetical protein
MVCFQCNSNHLSTFLYTVRITGDDYFFIDRLSIEQRAIADVELFRCYDCSSIWINEEYLQKRIEEEIKKIEFNKQ